MRALISSIGMPRAWVSVSIAGQSSLSVQTARSGRQWSRKRRTQGSTSMGTYWCRQFSGSRSARNCAEVTVPVVTRQLSLGPRLGRAGAASRGVKGTIAPGFDADIVVFDPDHERTISAETHHMNVDYSCYEGRK